MLFFLWQKLDVPPPLPRPHGALWVYVSHEPTFYSDLRNQPMVDQLSGQVNVLMSYERRSTLHSPYGWCQPHSPPLQALPQSISLKRVKPAVIVESNCNSSNRNAKLSALSPLMDIDVMGRCGTVKHAECDKHNPDCFKLLAQSYYFYVAIENSECPNYITEKIWKNSFAAGMVPIVWSKHVDYKTLLPPNSYINVADFDDVVVFADYIKEIVAYPHLFRRFFEWRKHYGVSYYNIIDGLCQFAIDNLGKELPPVDIPRVRTCFSDLQPEYTPHAQKNQTSTH